MQDLVQDLIDGISGYFSSLFEGAPLVFGSKYPVFLLEVLLIIVIFDVVIFGWRPLVRRYLPDHYHAVDYYFAQSVNAIAFLLLVALDFYLGSQLGESWGSWIGISGLVWLTLAILGVMMLARFASTMMAGKKPGVPTEADPLPRATKAGE